MIIAVLSILVLVTLKNLLFSTVTQIELEKEIDPNAEPEETTVIREFTPRELSNFNGFDLEKIYIAVKGNVYDVSKGRQIGRAHV